MICKSCGNTFDDNLTVCPVCGISAAQPFTEQDNKKAAKADHSNSQKNTSPSKRENAAAVTGLIIGGLCSIFNIVVLIFSQTGTGEVLFEIAVWELYLLVPYWFVTFLGMILCINRPDSRKNAIACLIICVINTIIYAIMFKVFLMPYYVNQLSEIFSPPMPYNLDK